MWLSNTVLKLYFQIHFRWTLNKLFEGEVKCNATQPEPYKHTSKIVTYEGNTLDELTKFIIY